MSLHMLGARSARSVSMLGLDYGKLAGGLLSTAGEVAEGVQADDAAKTATAADKSKADAAATADTSAALAKAAALTSAAIAATAPAASKAKADAKAAADQQALDIASTNQDAAGAAAGATASTLRAAAAQKQLAAATAKLQADPTNVYTQNLVKAWQWVMNKGSNVEIVKNAPDSGKKQTNEGFLSTKIVGPVKVWHAGAGLGLAGGLWYAVKKGLFHKLGVG